MGLGGAGSSPGRRPRIRIVMPPSSTKICGAPRATVSRAIVAPNISTYHSADACGFSLMMCTWSNLKAGLLIVFVSHRVPMPGLVPGVHDFLCPGKDCPARVKDVDGRDKPRHTKRCT